MHGKVEVMTANDFKKANNVGLVVFHLLINSFTLIPLYAAFRKALSITGQYLQRNDKTEKSVSQQMKGKLELELQTYYLLNTG